MATERIHEPGTQNEVAKALKGRENEGLVTIPYRVHCASLRQAKYDWQKNNTHN